VTVPCVTHAVLCGLLMSSSLLSAYRGPTVHLHDEAALLLRKSLHAALLLTVALLGGPNSARTVGW
jgi:hypothetical protein